VQVGTQSRSRPITQRFVEYVQSGKIGKVHMAKVANIEFRPDIGHLPDEPVPPGVNYDLWTGPAPMLPFNRNRFHNTYKWHWNYGTGEIGNNGCTGWTSAAGCSASSRRTRSAAWAASWASTTTSRHPTPPTSFNYDHKVIAWEGGVDALLIEGSRTRCYGTEGMAHAGRWVGGPLRVQDLRCQGS
jgi:hypothetical protein